MESYDNRVIIKDSDIKKPLDDKIHLENAKDSSNSPVSHSNNVQYSNLECNEEIFYNKSAYSNKKPFMMPNELYIGLNSESSQASNMCSKTDRLDFFSVGCHSTPASPEETERVRGKQMKKDLSSFHSPSIEKKMPFSYSTSFVRTSRSEDHLQKSSLTTVNIDIEDELASSLDTLLDTKADEVYNEIGDEECLSGSCPGVAYSRAKSPCDHQNSSKSDVSPSSSETASPSKVSIKLTDAQNAKPSHSDPLSESSGSEIIPSDSSTTIRRDSDGSNECECTSEQISAISSLDDATDLSRATDSDLGSPDGSLSPGSEINMEDDWVKDVEKRENMTEVFQDITNKSKIINKTIKQVPHHIELSLTSGVPETCKQQLSLQVGALEKSPTSRNTSLPVPKEDKLDIPSIDSPTSQCSEDTFADVSYHELTESYDEVSVATESEEVVEQPAQRSESPPTDDESDIESLHSFHYSPKAVDLPSAIRLAKRLYSLDGFKKTDVSRHLSKKYDKLFILF